MKSPSASSSPARPSKRQRLNSSDQHTPSSVPETNSKHQARRQRNQRTLYASISGHSTTQTANTLNTPSLPNTGAPVTPWESLALTSRHAPDRYEEPELDTYEFHRWLPERQTYGNEVYEDVEAIPGLRRKWRRKSEREDAVYDSEGKRSGKESVTSDEEMGGKEDDWKAAKTKESFLKDSEDVGRLKRQQDGLPSSDMTKAILRYSSYFYHAMHDKADSSADPPDSSNKQRSHTNHSLKSMDETALLAMAILMEESARAIVAPKPSAVSSKHKSRNTRNHSAGVNHADGGEGWRALMVGKRSDRDQDALDLVDGTGMSVIRDGGRMRRDRRKWEDRKAKRVVMMVGSSSTDEDYEASGSQSADAPVITDQSDSSGSSEDEGSPAMHKREAEDQ